MSSGGEDSGGEDFLEGRGGELEREVSQADSSVGDGDGDGEATGATRLKTSCEACSAVKVKCSGEVPCNRCVRKGISCEYMVGKKRGRPAPMKKKNVCSTSSCWSQVLLNPIIKSEDFGGKFHLDSVERRVFQTFFTLYRHHATPHSCCREWFSYQLNKMITFLKANGNMKGSDTLENWMKSKGVVLRNLTPSDFAVKQKNVKDEESGMTLPPVLSTKAPMLGNFGGANEPPVKRNRMTRVLTTNEFTQDPFRQDAERMREEQAYLCFRSVHEEFEIEVNDKFVSLFGFTALYTVQVMERLLGGLLPWTCDILAILLTSDADLLLVMRILALQFTSLDRPKGFPDQRQVQCTHVIKTRTQKGDIIECVLNCLVHETISVEGTSVDIHLGFRPVIPNTPYQYSFLVGTAGPNKRKSRAGNDTTFDGESLKLSFPKSDEQETSAVEGSYFDSNPSSPPPQNNETVSDSNSGPRPPVDTNAPAYANQVQGVEFLDWIMNWADGPSSGQTLFGNNSSMLQGQAPGQQQHQMAAMHIPYVSSLPLQQLGPQNPPGFATVVQAPDGRPWDVAGQSWGATPATVIMQQQQAMLQQVMQQQQMLIEQLQVGPKPTGQAPQQFRR